MAQNAVPNMDNDVNSNPALLGLSDRVSVNLVGTSYVDEESYFGTKVYETSMTASQASIGLRSRLLNTELGSSSSKVQMIEVSSGRKVTETESRAPLFQGSLTISSNFSLGAGLIRNSRDYRNYDNSSLNGIRTVDRYNAGTVLNLGPLFFGYQQFISHYGESPARVAFSRRGTIASIGVVAGSLWGDMGSIEYARTTQDAVKKESDGERAGIDVGEISGYSFSFSAVVNNIMLGLYRGEQTAKQSPLFVEILDDYRYSVTVYKLGYRPRMGFSIFVASISDKSRMTFEGLYQSYFGSEYFTAKGSGTTVGMGYTF
ncbi:MAG TPA: hypothetical protein QF683_09055 [SAR324 cluster bacterium]|nr:hypothetical protein [SAR324 cluster bacterium]MEE1574687.1 hypothetical protein [Deltaproteobacteria bacterium]MDP6246128.1 hypothetical protein [SAR324 cluster bacterium]MDP6329807.1 hypothetical protein [SAR324 cluster bacterium]MDP6462404.1 hypothetical protein [SAR324 cluster bacterium]